jgi:hypothetical protein
MTKSKKRSKKTTRSKSNSRASTMEVVSVRAVVRAAPAVRPAAAGPAIPTITVPPGGTLMIIVDVGPMSVPYTVSYNGRTVFKGLVDAAEGVPLVTGRQVLGWAFVHAVPGWHHTIAYSVDDEDPVVLESKSALKNDEGQSVGFAFVDAS